MTMESCVIPVYNEELVSFLASKGFEYSGVTLNRKCGMNGQGKLYELSGSDRTYQVGGEDCRALIIANDLRYALSHDDGINGLCFRANDGTLKSIAVADLIETTYRADKEMNNLLPVIQEIVSKNGWQLTVFDVRKLFLEFQLAGSLQIAHVRYSGEVWHTWTRGNSPKPTLRAILENLTPETRED